MDEAIEAFEAVRGPDTFLHNIMIHGFVDAGLTVDALAVYCAMLMAGACPDCFTFPIIVKCCARLQSLGEGPAAHATVIKLGLEHDVYTGNSLVTFYAKLGLVEDAERVFDGMLREAARQSGILDTDIKARAENATLVKASIPLNHNLA
ncbi:hypothetical protein ABZP36_010237 [Zizania latifolia]